MATHEANIAESAINSANYSPGDCLFLLCSNSLSVTTPDFAVVLCLSDPIRPILDDILAAADSAFVRFCHLDHAVYSAVSLTLYHDHPLKS